MDQSRRNEATSPRRIDDHTAARRYRIPVERWRRLDAHHRQLVLRLLALLLFINRLGRLLQLPYALIGLAGSACTLCLYTVLPASPLTVPVAVGGGACATTLLLVFKTQTA